VADDPVGVRGGRAVEPAKRRFEIGVGGLIGWVLAGGRLRERVRGVNGRCFGAGKVVV